LLAIDYLNLNGIMHRDIKPENILLSKVDYCQINFNIFQNFCKLCDFGTAAPFNNERRLTFCGTPDYMAPEIAIRGASYRRHNNSGYD